MSLLVDYETDTGRVNLDVSAEATMYFGHTFQDRVITHEGKAASVIGTQRNFYNPSAGPTLYVLYDGDPFVKPVDPATVSVDTIKGWKKLADSTTSASLNMQNTKEFHHLREINCFGKRRTIVMQSQNGPCPVIAIANCLLLRGQLDGIEKLAVGRQDAVATATQLQEAVLEVIKQRKFPPPEFSETAREDGTLKDLVASAAFENLRTTLADPERGPVAMKRYYDGLFVEPVHDVVDGFASSEDAAVFALAGCKLVHGWIMDFQDNAGKDTSGLRKLSCSELQVAATVDNDEGRMAQNFLNSTMTQTTDLGVTLLSSELADHEAVVMFRNNHFSACLQHEGKLYSLVTDVGFTQRNDVVWQEVKVNDDGAFVDGACGNLEPVVMRALEKFDQRFSVEQIRSAVAALMENPSDLMLMAIQEQIDGKRPTGAPAAAAAVASSDGAAAAAGSVQQTQNNNVTVLTGTVLQGSDAATSLALGSGGATVKPDG